MPKIVTKACLMIVVATCCLLAQTPAQNAIESTKLNVFPQPDFYLDVHFTNPLDNPDAELTAENLTLTTSPDPLDSPLVISGIARLPGSRKAARISFSSTPPSKISSVNLCFKSLTFRQSSGPAQMATNICSAVQILNPSNIAAEKAKLLKELQEVPKTSEEKNVFASGFVTTASSGSAGGLDLDLNSNQLGIPGMTAFLRTKKTSTAGGDPKNFESGVNFKNAYIFGGGDFDKMKKQIAVINSPTSTDAQRAQAQVEINAAEKTVQHRLLSAVIVNFAGKLEGGATDFNVANYVGDGALAIQSRTKKLFGSKHGFWQFRVVPVGAEGGKNVQNNTAAAAANTQDFVARYKGGAELTAFYDDPDSALPFKQVKLTITTAQRYLFFKEAETLSATSAPILASGHRPWYEGHLLIYLADAPSGRYGFRLDYKNGSLPPNFAVAKSFQFGFVFETKDGEQKKPVQ